MTTQCSQVGGAGYTGLIVAALAILVSGAALGAAVRVHGSPGPSQTSEVSEPAWVKPLLAVDEAVASKNLSRAIYGWHEAYGAALGSRRWEGLAAVGDAALRIDALAGPDREMRAEARRVYLAALFLARSQRSPGGIRRIADAFASLGDAEMAAQARRMAEDLS